MVEGSPIPVSTDPAATVPPQSAIFPGDLAEASVAPGTADLMGRVRSSHACLLHDREFARRYGTPADGWLIERFSKCGVMVNSDVEPGAGYIFELSLADAYLSIDRDQDTAEAVGGHEVFRSRTSYGTHDCTYYLPIGKTGFAHGLRGRRVHSPGQPSEWPARCESTKEYLGALADTLIEMPPRDIGASPGSRSLVQKNPCAADVKIRDLFPGWNGGQTGWVSAYSCTLDLSKPGDPYKITVTATFMRNNEQAAVRPEDRVVTHEGMSGVEYPSTGNAALPSPNKCGYALTYVPAAVPGAATAHVVSVSVDANPHNPLAASWPAAPFDMCERARAVSSAVLAGIG
ncbi:hypothetical protein ACSVDM_11250 [Nocardia sp. JW2]|uniref:hypothetical protein n=1 Tax=Nocardia sp. JW2 TaxID=3450738 RepID=UPI003F42373E